MQADSLSPDPGRSLASPRHGSCLGLKRWDSSPPSIHSIPSMSALRDWGPEGREAQRDGSVFLHPRIVELRAPFRMPGALVVFPPPSGGPSMAVSTSSRAARFCPATETCGLYLVLDSASQKLKSASSHMKPRTFEFNCLYFNGRRLSMCLHILAAVFCVSSNRLSGEHP